ncbi:MAG: hypothetical protein QXT64_03770 [Desulfurococcaceae archaeon]
MCTPIARRLLEMLREVEAEVEATFDWAYHFYPDDYPLEDLERLRDRVASIVREAEKLVEQT